jgi:hypothetical protein
MFVYREKSNTYLDSIEKDGCGIFTFNLITWLQGFTFKPVDVKLKAPRDSINSLRE